jgi:Rieske Fe-S protein
MADQLTRRTALAGTAGLTAALPLLAACGGSSAGDSGSARTQEAEAGTVLGPASAVPVGGGKIYGDANVVVTQPEAGTFKAFSATCTHQGCQVSKVASGTIDCACHQSRFSIEDGSVEGGPAPKPLPEVAISVQGDQLTLA